MLQGVTSFYWTFVPVISLALACWSQDAYTASGRSLLGKTVSEEKQTREKIGLFGPKKDLSGFIDRYTEIINTGGLTPLDKATALIHRGSLYSEQGDCARAIPDFDEAIRLNLKSSKAYALRASCYLAINSTVDALRDLDHAISFSPQDVILYRERATLFARLKQYDRAVADYSKSIALLKGTDSSEMFELRGDAYRGALRYERAIDDYQRAVRTIKKNAARLSPQPTAGVIPRLLVIYGKLSETYQDLAKSTSPAATAVENPQK